MHLTRFTDYALRVLTYVAKRPDEWVTIRQISDDYGISRNHLMKVVSFLGSRGYLLSQRGPGGGIRLKLPAEDVSLSRVILDTEGELNLLRPDKGKKTTLDSSGNRLTEIFEEAVQSFLNTLNTSSLADLIDMPEGAQPGTGAH